MPQETDLNELRERLAVSESKIAAHAEVLTEMKEAVKGINNSLHTLTRLEERAEAHRSEQAHTRQLLLNEERERKEQSKLHGQRIGTLEGIIHDVDVDTKMNSHGRGMIEHWAPVITAALAGPVSAIIINLFMAARVAE